MDGLADIGRHLKQKFHKSLDVTWQSRPFLPEVRAINNGEIDC